MTAPGNAYPAVQLDADGKVVDSGTVIQFTDATIQPGTGGGGGLPTGWTEDENNPANVTTHGAAGDTTTGGLLVGVSGDQGVQIRPQGIRVLAASTGEQEILLDSAGVTSAPDAGAAFTADDSRGATVALDCGGLYIIGLPTSDPGVAGALYTTGGAVLVSSG